MRADALTDVATEKGMLSGRCLHRRHPLRIPIAVMFDGEVVQTAAAIDRGVGEECSGGASPATFTTRCADSLGGAVRVDSEGCQKLDKENITSVAIYDHRAVETLSPDSGFHCPIAFCQWRGVDAYAPLAAEAGIE